MKKVRKIHFWIGVTVSLFLLIESISGIFLYFQEQGRAERQFPPQVLMEQQTNGDSQQNSNTGNSGVSKNNMPAFPNGQNGKFNQGNMMKGSGVSANSIVITFRNLHSGIVGLIAGIGMLVLTVTGLSLSWVIGRRNRMKRNNPKAIGS